MQELKNAISNIIQKKRNENEFCVLTTENSVDLVYKLLTELQSNHFIKYDPNSSNNRGEVIFLEAPTGSGKDNIFLQLSLQNPDKKYVELNMDIFRKYYPLFIPDVAELNDMDFAKATNQFTYELFILIQEILLECFPGTNIIITGTLREIDWNESLMRRYKEDPKTDYKVKLISLAIPKDEGLYSTIKRYVYIADGKIRESNSKKGTARYTSSEYYHETYEGFINNFGYFVNMFNQEPGKIIDCIEIYRRNRSLKDFKDDNLVYSSDRISDKLRNPMSVIKELREQAYSVPKDDAIDTLDLIIKNKDYLQGQDTLIDILYTLAPLLNYRREKKEEASPLQGQNCEDIMI